MGTCLAVPQLLIGRHACDGRRTVKTYKVRRIVTMKKVMSQKKAYEKPAVIHRQVMESVAGACQVTGGVNGKADAACTVTFS